MATNPSASGSTATAGNHSGGFDLQTLSRSPLPAFGLSALFIASAFAPPKFKAKTFTPPFVFRLGFGAIFAGGGYMLAAGDAHNGSGVMTAWSLSYFVIEQFSLGLQASLRRPRSPIALALSTATGASAALYGSEYFSLNEEEPDY
ncbi:unnamed protein product [Peniophora sp. CBMAI 1063]|nr:unnamed protein product [Peniophora sp. CBMAI 1063]